MSACEHYYKLHPGCPACEEEKAAWAKSELAAPTLLAPDGRPMSITLKQPVPCCGSRLIIQCDGTFRCPCGKRQERAAKESICASILGANDKLCREQGERK